MKDLDHKRRQCRNKADEMGQPWVIFTTSDDFEPKVLCDCPLAMLPDGADVVEHVYPRVSV